MVAPIHKQPVNLSPLDSSPRRWYTLDGKEPPRRGEPAYVTLLVGVRKRDDWRPDSLHAVPPVTSMLGACALEWSRDREAIRRDVEAFNANQLRQRSKGARISLWAAVGFGLAQYPMTADIVREVQS